MKTLKKTLLAVTALCAVVCSAGAMGSSCNPEGEGGGETSSGHVHTWDGGTVTTPAECEKAGVKTFTCTDPDCAETKTEPVAALNHNWTSWVVEKPTDSKKGVAVKTCKTEKCQGKIEIELPVLTDEAYSKTDDTATTSAGGHITYTYANTNGAITFDVSTPKKGLPKLSYGESSVECAAYTGVMYTFTSETDKAYSLTVPDGMEVNLITGGGEFDFEELIVSANFAQGAPHAANFVAKAGVPVTFEFTSAGAGAKTVTIGEVLEDEAKVFKLGESKTMTASGVHTYTVSRTVPAGKYLFAAVVGGKSMMQAQLVLEVNGVKATMQPGAGLNAGKKVEGQYDFTYTLSDYIVFLELNPGDEIKFSSNAGTSGTVSYTLLPHIGVNDEQEMLVAQTSGKRVAMFLVGDDVAEGQYALNVTAKLSGNTYAVTVSVNGSTVTDLTSVTLKAGDVIKIEGSTKKAAFTGTFEITPAD